MANEHQAGTTSILEVATEMAPGDPFIADFLRIFSNEEEVRLSANTEIPEKKINLIRGGSP